MLDANERLLIKALITHATINHPSAGLYRLDIQ